MRVDFSEWRPDAADLTTPYMTLVKNCLPGPKGYRPMPAIASAVAMSALTARCQGAAAFISPIDEQTYVVAGDTTALYQQVGSSAVNVSKSGGYNCPSDDFWEFVALSGDVIAVNINDPMQAATMNGTLVFADLATSTLKPMARHIAVIGQQAMIGNTEESGTRRPNRVRWCGVDSDGLANAADWDASQTTLAGFQDMEDGLGGVQRIVGGERYGLVLCDHGVARADFVGTPDIYTFTKLADGVGCIAPGSVVRSQGITYYLSPQGLVACNGVSTVRLGSDKWDTWFFDNVYGPSLYHRISACFDAERHIYMMGFPSTSSTGQLDFVLCYHIPTGRATYLDGENLQFLLETRRLGVTLEQLDTHPLGNASLDAMTLSLDSKIWAGGDPVLAAFNSSNAMVLWEANGNKTATLETSVLEPVDGHRAMIDHARPLADSGTLTVALAMRERLNDTESFGSAVTQNTNGICPFETGNVGRFAKVRATDAGNSWSHVEAVDLKAIDLGMF